MMYLQTYKDIKIEKEVQFRFLDHIVELIEVGIIVIDQNEKVADKFSCRSPVKSQLSLDLGTGQK